MSGGFNPINLVSQIALGVATGGTSLVAQFAMQVISQIAREVISEVGKQLGLPPQVIDGAVAAFDAAAGNPGGAAQSAAGMINDFASSVGASPAQAGQMHQAADGVRDAIRDMIQNNAKDELEGRGPSGSSGSGGGAKSWLMAMAEAFGERLDKMADDIQDLADSIDKEDPSTTVKYSAATQEFNLLMNTANTALKTLGEALANTARKQ